MRKFTKKLLVGVVALGLIAPIAMTNLSNAPRITVQAKRHRRVHYRHKRHVSHRRYRKAHKSRRKGRKARKARKARKPRRRVRGRRMRRRPQPQYNQNISQARDNATQSLNQKPLNNNTTNDEVDESDNGFNYNPAYESTNPDVTADDDYGFNAAQADQEELEANRISEENQVQQGLEDEPSYTYTPSENNPYQQRADAMTNGEYNEYDED